MIDNKGINDIINDSNTIVGFNKNNLKEVIELQNKLNSKTSGDNWTSKKHNWKLAIFLEVAEMIESFDWKWWKNGKTDWDNIEIEMVDIFHFLISLLLQNQQEHLLENFFISREIQKQDYPDREELKEKIIDKMSYRFTQYISVNGYAPAIMEFLEVWYMLGYNSDDLFRKYKMKYTLNIFRQNHGYKEGSYIKLWKLNDTEVEDNVYAQMLQDKIENDQNYIDKLYQLLEETYNNINKEEPNILSDFIKSNNGYLQFVGALPEKGKELLLTMLENYKIYKK